MNDGHSVPMTRARIYGLVAAFEADMRRIFEQHVKSEVGEQAALGSSYNKATIRFGRDNLPEADRPTLVHYLDLKETYDLLNSHRDSLPSALSAELLANLVLIDEINIIRRRVAHSRPLAPGDGERSVSMLSQFKTRWWSELSAILGRLEQDPNWEPANFPERELSSVLHNLPYAEFDETGLIGRHCELEEILKLIKRRREPIVTIVGEGGVGKTALAVQAAYELVDSDDCPFEAVLWTSLKSARLTASGIREIKGSARTLLGALESTHETVGMEGVEDYTQLATALDGIRCLLILDNLETVGAADFRQLYEALPDTVSYLVTSRVGIGEFERRYLLDPLSEEDALELFDGYARTRQQKGQLALSRETRLELVRRLRCSPLAIRWYILSVEAGRDPYQTIHDQSELLDFCVKSVYDELSSSAQSLLTAMMVMGRDVSLDEAVILLDVTPDAAALAMQELVRGSMVRRVTSPEKAELRLLARLTETASSFLNVVDLGSTEAQQISARKMEMLRIGEQRIKDSAERSLAPIVFRTRNSLDGASAHILREAYLKFTARENDAAFLLLEKAKELNPDYWEVYRLQGYMRGTLRQEALAESAFQRAIELANGDPEATAVVSHFYAGHTARAMKNPDEAVVLERAAHDYFNSAETGGALGNYLVWSGKYQEGIDILKASLVDATGKTRLICGTALAESWVRLAEHTESTDSNVLMASDQAWEGYLISRDLLLSGVVDRKLRDVTVDAARLTIRWIVLAALAGLDIREKSTVLSTVERDLPLLAVADRFPTLVREVSRLSECEGGIDGAKSLIQAVELASSHGGSQFSGLVYRGALLNLHPTFGFVEVRELEDNVFFHQSAWVDQVPFADLREGDKVAFSLQQDGERLKGEEVRLDE